jgi:hypothetical protein
MNNCYVVCIAALKLYQNMGMFTITLKDLAIKRVTELDVDGIWQPHISIPSDFQVTNNDNNGCTKITTYPQVEGRGGNKDKIMTLSAIKCIIK